MKRKALLLALVVAGISGMALASEQKEIGEIKLSWNSHGKVGFWVNYKGDTINAPIGMYLGEGKGYCGNKAETQIGRLVRASQTMGLKFVQKNELSFGYWAWLKSFVTKPVEVGQQTLRLHEDGSTSYDGQDSLKEEFAQNSKEIFDGFETLHELQRDHKKEDSL